MIDSECFKILSLWTVSRQRECPDSFGIGHLTSFVMIFAALILFLIKDHIGDSSLWKIKCMVSRQFAILMFLIISVNSFAQRWSDLDVKKSSAIIDWRISYLATIKYPGLQLAAELPLKSKVFFQGDTTHRKKLKQHRLTISYTFYQHKTFHSNNMLTAGYVWRRTNRKGWFFDAGAQAGLSRTFIHGTTYKVVDANKVERQRLAGDWFWVANFGFSIGKAINVNQDFTNVFVKPSIIALFPYNNFIYLRPGIQIGISIRPFRKLAFKETIYYKIRN